MNFRILFSSLALLRGPPSADAMLTAGRDDPGSILGSSASGSGSPVESDAGEALENGARWVGDVDVGDAEEVEYEKKRDKPKKVARDSFTVLERVRHDKSSFTQGLSYGKDGTLFETTGLNGQSKVRRIDSGTFELERSIDVDGKFFGEGSAYYTDAMGNERLIHITWKEGTGFVYDARTLEKVREFEYETGRGNEGWGITYDPSKQEFIVSDGSKFLYFWDRDTLKEKRKVAVTRFDGKKQDQLNELEYMDGLVCMNIWYSDDIICVDPSTGKSVREYDMSSLWAKGKRGRRGAGVLNGIAIGKDHVLLTGKNWDRMYKVAFPDWPTLF